LRPDQTLKFEPQLTVVFGDNASGKSGRMVNNVYRARVVDEILGHVRSDVPAEGERSATFTVKPPC
jgi:predicted ATPase